MDDLTREKTAVFRYSLISGVVDRKTPLQSGEINEYFKEVASKEYLIPNAYKTTVSVRTLERYKSDYEKNGLEGLKPCIPDKSGHTKVSNVILEKAVNLKKEQPERSIEQILCLLNVNSDFSSEPISASTISRYFRKQNISKATLLSKEPKVYGYKKFEAEKFGDIWQADFQHTLYLPDPKNPKRNKKALLFAILDDFSRYIVHAQFYWDEQLPRLEDSLKKAILKHGVPEKFYCDNGSAFSAHHLARICAKLQIKLAHSMPYKPMGRGKIERLFRFVDTSFKGEAYLQIERKEICTLEDLNNALNNWIEGYYHLRIHGTTKVSPTSRMESANKNTLKMDLQEFRKVFFYEEKRKADKISRIQLLGNEYEVEQELAKKEVLVRYDAFDLSVLEVWHEGKQYKNAIPYEIRNPKNYKKVNIDEKINSAPVSLEKADQINFFSVLKNKKEQQYNEVSFSYAKGGANNER